MPVLHKSDAAIKPAGYATEYEQSISLPARRERTREGQKNGQSTRPTFLPASQCSPFPNLREGPGMGHSHSGCLF